MTQREEVPVPNSDDVAEVVAVLAAHAADVDARSRFPVESFAQLRRRGYLGLLVPAEYGGMGGGLTELTALAQQFAGGCLSTAMSWAMHCQQTDLVVRHATPELRARLLPRIAAGEVYLASVTTESSKGGHLLSAHDALRGADGYSLDREAPVVTGGMHADGFLITMRDGPDAAEHEVTLVYADSADLKIEQTAVWQTMGMRGTDSVGVRLVGRVAPDCVVGERGKFRQVAADSMVPVGHLAWSACWLGAARAVFGQLVRRIAAPRQKSGGPDVNSPLVQERVARIRLDLELVSAYLGKVTEEVGQIRARGGRLDMPAVQIHLNTLKLAASELTFRAADRMVQLAGLAAGYGTDSPLPLERTFRDLRSAALNYSNDRLWTANGTLSWADRAVSLL
ncbi:acyl-CoA dehydrogenase family protein [Streptomyces xanthochromogenes]|uniref:acyl-CoA dehydrogenase family protein n=1 Tax=Streptomyces xanthochromogenes TaxID=67384 RepID=UPI0016742F8E|nr:acyl-CoA dehydrogenase family protein [Streptomyces xanthochromogenes]